MRITGLIISFLLLAGCYSDNKEIIPFSDLATPLGWKSKLNINSLESAGTLTVLRNRDKSYSVEIFPGKHMSLKFSETSRPGFYLVSAYDQNNYIQNQGFDSFDGRIYYGVAEISNSKISVYRFSDEPKTLKNGCLGNKNLFRKNNHDNNIFIGIGRKYKRNRIHGQTVQYNPQGNSEDVTTVSGRIDLHYTARGAPIKSTYNCNYYQPLHTTRIVIDNITQYQQLFDYHYQNELFKVESAQHLITFRLR